MCTPLHILCTRLAEDNNRCSYAARTQFYAGHGLRAPRSVRAVHHTRRVFRQLPQRWTVQGGDTQALRLPSLVPAAHASAPTPHARRSPTGHHGPWRGGPRRGTRHAGRERTQGSRGLLLQQEGKRRGQACVAVDGCLGTAGGQGAGRACVVKTLITLHLLSLSHARVASACSTVPISGGRHAWQRAELLELGGASTGWHALSTQVAALFPPPWSGRSLSTRPGGRRTCRPS